MTTGREFRAIHSTGFLVDRVAHHLGLGVQQFLKEEGIGLTAHELGILTVVVGLDEPRRMADLAGLLGRDPTTLTRQIGGLERLGLVERYVDPSDRRAVRVSATAAGVRMVERTMPLTMGLRRRAMDGISPAEEEVVVRTLQRMLENLSPDG